MPSGKDVLVIRPAAVPLRMTAAPAAWHQGQLVNQSQQLCPVGWQVSAHSLLVTYSSAQCFVGKQLRCLSQKEFADALAHLLCAQLIVQLFTSVAADNH
jgi:hypothetical protein